ALPPAAAAATRSATAARLYSSGVVAVLRFRSGATALAAADAVIAGGIRAVEVTLTTPGATRVIASLTARYPDVAVGAGTVLGPRGAAAGAAAGAAFFMSPVGGLGRGEKGGGGRMP
ncbi:hypothetical protein MMPV_003646, partial [Pyropia vietnamensis]